MNSEDLEARDVHHSPPYMGGTPCFLGCWHRCAMFHMIGQDHFPEKDGVYSPTYETSLVVVQFFAIATGEVPVHKPANGFRTVRLVGEERYCLGCCGVRWHDVVFGDGGRETGDREQFARCRVCEKVGEV